MHTAFSTTARRLGAAAVLASSILLLPVLATRAAETPPAPPAAEAAHEHLAKHYRAHLDHLADRLEIKASQEGAWQKFTASFIDTLVPLHGHDARAPHDAESDAASLAKHLAERAAEHAQKLSRLADATAALQQVLSPEQRLVFDEAARRFARSLHGHHDMTGHEPGHGEWIGAHEGPHCEGPDGPSHHDGAGHGPWHHEGDGPGHGYHDGDAPHAE